jgi:hypothetical protein
VSRVFALLASTRLTPHVPFDIIPAVFRRILLCLLLGAIGRGQTLDEAVRSLAKKVAARIAPGEVAHVATVRNLSSLGNAETARARAVFERTLRQSTAKRGNSIEIALTISHNSGGLLLVAEIERGDDRQVEMVEYTAPAAPERSTHALLDKHLLWEQDVPILDVLLEGDAMLVLEPTEIVDYARRPSGWERVEAKPLDGAVAVRDPRGQFQVAGDSLMVSLPGLICHGVWKPALDVHCESGGTETKFTPARNTLQVQDWPVMFSFAQTEERARPLYLAAELDGNTHLYDGARRPVGKFDTWGDDFTVIDSGCGADHAVLASAPSARDAVDSVTAFEIVDRKPMEISDPAEFPGPVTALGPTPGGAIAIARDLASGRYAAYTLTLNCSH